MKTINIFVSSIFKEMGIERDVLHRVVNATLREKYKDQDINFSFIDLRWGVDNRNFSDSSKLSHFTIQKCFDAIDDSDLFLGILGKDYGSLADIEVSKNLFPYLKNKKVSYTHLEIEYAKKVLDKSKLLFLLKDDVDFDEGISSLRDEIKKNYFYKTYHVNNDNTLKPDFISSCIDLLVSNIETCKNLKKKETILLERTKVINDILHDKHTFVCIKAPFGYGKTTILEIINKKLISEQNKVIFLRNIHSNSKINNEYQTFYKDVNSVTSFIECLKSDVISSNKKIYLLIDNIETLSRNELYYFYSSLHCFGDEKLKIIIAFENQAYISSMVDMDVSFIEVGKLNKEEILNFVSLTAKAFDKTMYQEINDFIIKNKDVLDNPLSLKLLLSQLMVISSEVYNLARCAEDYTTAMIGKMKEIIANFPENIKEQINWKIKDIDKYIYPDFATFLMKTIQTFGRPISMDLLKNVFYDLYNVDWSDYDFYTYKLYLSGILKENEHHEYYFDILDLYNPSLIEQKYIDAISRTLLKANDITDITKSFAFLSSDDKTIANLISSNDYTDNDYYRFAEAMNLLFSIHDDDFIEAKCNNIFSLLDGSTKDKFYKSFLSGGNADVKPFVSHIIFRSITNNFNLSRLDILNGTTVMLKIFTTYGVDNGIISYLSHADSFFDECNSVLNDAESINILNTLLDSSVAIDEEEKTVKYISKLTELYLLNKNVDNISSSYIERMFKFDDSKLFDVLNHVLTNKNFKNSNNYIRIMDTYIQILLKNNKLDQAHDLIEEIYIEAKTRYDKNIDDEGAIENYSWVLYLRAMFIKKDDLEQQYKIYRELYEIRQIQVNINPNEFHFLNSFSVIVMTIIKNNIEIGITYDVLLQRVYTLLESYAKRGNTKSSWLFTNLFSELSDNPICLEFFVDKLEKLDIFINQICELNYLNANYLTEIVSTFLNIYHSYCEARILPLESGRLILDKLFEISKQVIELDRCFDSYRLFLNVYNEIYGILVQDTSKIETKDPYFLKAQEIFDRAKEIDNSYSGQMFALGNDCMQLFSYAAKYMEMKNNPMFGMIISSIGENFYKDSIEKLVVIAKAAEEMIQHDHRIYDHVIQTIVVAAKIIADGCTNILYRETATKIFNDFVKFMRK